jgi:hypothetical protein
MTTQLPLPGILLTWAQITPVAPDTFVQYNVKRRLLGDTSWTRLAVIAALGTTRYTDYTPASATTYQYTVTWTSNRSGNIFESPEASAVNASVTFTGTFLHDATPGGGGAANYVRLPTNRRTVEPIQAATQTAVWGRQPLTVTYGTSEYRHVALGVVSQDPTDRTIWDQLRLLQRRQRVNGSPLCFRDGDMKDRLFVTLSKLSRNDPPYEYLPALELDEIYLNEAQ